jgi:glycosyltransferase involved in cell wall biosynthesis
MSSRASHATRRPPAARTRSVLFVAPEPLYPALTGPARRTVKLADAVAAHCAVTLAAPAPSVFPDGPFRTVETGPLDAQDVAAAASGHDVAVVQTVPSPRQLVRLRRRVPRLVFDLIAPLALELAETRGEPARRRAVVRWRAREMVAHVAAADLVLCTNERQRDLVVGAGVAAGLLDPSASPTFDERIAIVPHGIDPEPPPPRRPVLRSGGFASAGDRIAVWGGGLWSWLDPLTAIRAVERLRPARPDLKLAFVGLDHPDPRQRRAHEPRAAAASRYVRERGLEGTVAFRPRWLARNEYLEHLRDADVGVSLHADTLEGRYASRTRVLDYLAVGLPVVCTRGDTMSELVTAHALGEAVAASDVEACSAALDRLTSAPRRVDPTAALAPLRWTNVAQPLVDFCLDGRPQTPASAAWRDAARDYPAFLRAVRAAGGSGAIRRAALARAAGVLRRRRRD